MRYSDARVPYTGADLRGIRKLAQRIRHDLYIEPDEGKRSVWRDEQKIALRVIEARLTEAVKAALKKEPSW